MRIFLVGGGTGGPTTPLLAVAEELKRTHKDAEFFFIGINKKSEAKFLNASGLSVTHLTIPAGKLRRYFSLQNIIDVFRIFAGFIKALFLIRKYRPQMIFGAGSFVQVPVAWAGWVFGIPVLIHQQDWQILLSNRLVAPIASAVTTVIEGSMKDFSTASGLFRGTEKSRIFWTGNPVRKNILSGDAGRAREYFGLSNDYPTLLVLGGGTGSEKINSVIESSLSELVKYVQVIHVTGNRKASNQKHPHYHPYRFLTNEMSDAYAVADLVISRGGMSTISELSRLGKAAVFIPLPNSPQKGNVQLVTFIKAGIGVDEKDLTADLLVNLVRKILWNKDLIDTITKNIKKINPADADKKIAKIITNIVTNHEK